jgi:RNA recognition motif-containing protein
MRSIIFLLIVAISFCCNSKSSGHEIAKQKDTNQKDIEVGKLPLIFVEDTLTNAEKKFLSQILPRRGTVRKTKFILNKLINFKKRKRAYGDISSDVHLV